LKFSVFGLDDGLAARGQAEGIGTSSPRFVLRGVKDQQPVEQALQGGAEVDHDKALEFILDKLRNRLHDTKLVGVGHRVVHGGTAFADPVKVSPEVLDALDKLVPLAPLHQAHNLAPIRAVYRLAPAMPQVACFDTSFHRTQPMVAQRFGIPRRFEEEGIRRYGFHGLSYEYIAGALPKFAATAAAGKTVVAHLGNGASMCALLAGKSVATTMSFTPADGLVMGTRTGALDPGVLVYLMNQHKMDAGALQNLINHESGLLGVSGISSDMRALLASTAPRAAEAVELFVYRINLELGSLVAALGGLDALVFTAGIGENSAVIREKVGLAASWLGVAIDPTENRAGGPRISRPDSKVSVWVIPTNEELMIAQHSRRVLGLKKN
jgi:acetate kinase